MEGAPRTSRALFERASTTIGNKLEKQPLQETRIPLRAKFAKCNLDYPNVASARLDKASKINSDRPNDKMRYHT